MIKKRECYFLGMVKVSNSYPKLWITKKLLNTANLSMEKYW